MKSENYELDPRVSALLLQKKKKNFWLDPHPGEYCVREGSYLQPNRKPFYTYVDLHSVLHLLLRT